MDIAEDVRQAAIAALDAYRASNGASLLVAFEDQVGAMSLGILAERERCAKIAEAHDLDPEYSDAIARAIRSGAATE